MTHKSASSLRSVMQLYGVTDEMVMKKAGLSYSPVVAVIRGSNVDRVSSDSVSKIRRAIHKLLEKKGCPLSFSDLWLEDPAKLIRERAKEEVAA